MEQTNARIYRRELHRYPENGWTELRTSARIAQLLAGMGYENIKMGLEVVEPSVICEPVRLTQADREREMARAVEQGADPELVATAAGWPGVIAELDTGRPGPVTAFRFDIDCLPYTEPAQAGSPAFDQGYISCREGCVHACGHDGHTAIGLALAEAMYPLRDGLKGKIRFIFQPAEETWSGAASVVAKGWLDDVDYFAAPHMALDIPSGGTLPSHTIACGCKDFLSDCQLDVTFTGKAAHPGGAAHEGKNALLAACTAALNIHAIAPHGEGNLRVNVGELHAGVCPNTIAPNAELKLEYRGDRNDVAAYGRRRIDAILKGAAEMYEADYSVVDYGEVPMAKSDDKMMEIVRRAAETVPWFETVYFEGSVGGTDDAAAMIQRVQAHGGVGTYLGIGTDIPAPLHDPEFDLDEDALDAAVAMFKAMLLEIHG